MSSELAHLSVAALSALADTAQGNADALILIAMSMRQAGDANRAIALAARAVELAPDDARVRALRADVVSRSVPHWHFPMMRDEPRNAAYQAAITRAVKPGMRILDIGTGSGLLSMMAVRAGAGHVYAVEGNAAIAAVARQVIERNGMGDRITLFNTLSTQIDPDRDLGGRVDMVMSEILGIDVVCERVLPSLADARERLLTPGGVMLPLASEIRFAAAHWAGLGRQEASSDQCGFDLTPFNALQRQRVKISTSNPDLRVAGPAVTAMRFDFTGGAPDVLRASADLAVTHGPANGIVQWLAIDVDADTRYENPVDPAYESSWAMQFVPLSVPVDCGTVRVDAQIVKNILHFWHAI